MLGTGIIKGLAVTAKNLVGSFHDPARYVTTEYPEQRTKLPENYRNFPFLVSENAIDPMGTLRCVACQICEKECPPQCIYIEKSKDKKADATGKLQLYPAVFDIDTSVCMSCQICVEVCPFDAIKMDQVFEIATTDRFTGLMLNREQLAKENAYYHSIHPLEAAEVDARLAAERKAADEKARAAAAAKAAAPAKPPAASPAVKPLDEPRRSPTGEGGPPVPQPAAAIPAQTSPSPALQLPATSPVAKPPDEPRRLVSPKPGEGGPSSEIGPAP